MFRFEGPARSEVQNRYLAASLAFVGGFVNSAGFVLVGSFTSPVTGHVGRLSIDVAAAHYPAAGSALLMLGAFLAGAFVTGLTMESPGFRRRADAYVAVLLGEAALLGVFMLRSTLPSTNGPRGLDADAAILCLAMGAQNSLVTRLSGAVVRTTHLTGVVTDLGIELAQWVGFWRGARLGPTSMQRPRERPSLARLALLATIAAAFMGGALLGALACLVVGRWVLLVPMSALLLCACYARWATTGRPVRGAGEERGQKNA